MHILIAGKGRLRAALEIHDRVAGARLLYRADVCHDIPDLAWAQLVGRHLPQLEISDFSNFVILSRAGGEDDVLSWLDRAVDDAHARNGAPVPIVMRVEDQSAQRRIRIAGRRRHTRDDRLENLVDADAFL